MALDMTITVEDEQKIAGCDFYAKAKQIIQDAEEHKNIEVGGVYMLSYTNWDKEVKLYGGDSNPDKYVIIRNDNGFLFAKRIIASGQLGKQIFCLTIEYFGRGMSLIPDPSYVDAILLSDEENYDAAAPAKSLASKKNKSRRINDKKRFTSTTEDEILKELSTYTIGDKFWTSSMAYCNKIEEWVITKVTSKKLMNSYYRMNSNCRKNAIEFEVKNTNPSHWGHNGTSYDSDSFIKSGGSYTMFYKEKPTKLEDIV